MATDNYGGTGFFLSDLEAMPPLKRGRELVDSLVHLNKIIATFTQQREEATSLLFQLAGELNASVIDGTDQEVVISEGSADYEWEYDLEVLSELAAFLPPEIVDRALEPVPATFKVKKAELNKLARRGGKIAQVIERGCAKVPKYGMRKLNTRPKQV